VLHPGLVVLIVQSPWIVAAGAVDRRAGRLAVSALSVLPQPAKGRLGGVEDRDVAVVWAEPQL
jgi:hypothetical protein